MSIYEGLRSGDGLFSATPFFYMDKFNGMEARQANGRRTSSDVGRFRLCAASTTAEGTGTFSSVRYSNMCRWMLRNGYRVEANDAGDQRSGRYIVGCINGRSHTEFSHWQQFANSTRRIRVFRKIFSSIGRVRQSRSDVNASQFRRIRISIKSTTCSTSDTTGSGETIIRQFSSTQNNLMRTST